MFRYSSLLVAISVACGAGPKTRPLVVPVDGAPFQAKLTSIDAAGVTTFELSTGETQRMQLPDICQWGTWAEASAGSQLALVDGSLLVADVLSLDKDSVTVDSSAAGALKLPLETVAGIIFSPPLGRQRQDELLAKLRSGRGESDKLLLANGDELEGEIGSADEVNVRVRVAGKELTVAKDKIAAVVLNPALATKPKRDTAVSWIGFQDGSRLLAVSLALEKDDWKFKLLVGPAASVKRDMLAAIAPLKSHAVYLSDLKPAGYQHIPFLTMTWPYKNDFNVLGTQLRAGGQLYLKGLGMHSAARLTYDLEKPYRVLAADLAIDDQTAGRGSVLFRVYIDNGDGTWRLKYDSPIIRGGAAPLGMSVDLAGAKRISLLVDFADRGAEQAHADWLNARLLP